MTTTAERPAYLLKRAQSALHETMAAALAEHGLTVSQYAALVGVVDEPGRSNADLARAAFVTPQTMNLLLRDLDERGLVDRTPHPQHGRVLQTRPTEAGRRTAAAATRAVAEVERRLVTGLTVTEQSALAAMLTACIDALDPAHR
ncbi:MarR family winged helix-turn-helix transcriptional regulator [Cellulomonas hominis]